MNLWLLVPVKPFAEGKSRLAKTLTPAKRADLNQTLLIHTLSTIRMAGLPIQTLVISRDRAALSVARQYYALGLAETGRSLNPALRQGRAFAMGHGADSLLVLPADLPLLTVKDLAALYRWGHESPSVVIAPSHDGGTSALLLNPPNVIDFAFGDNSFQRHCAAAMALDVPHHILHSETLQYDIDRPQDLHWMQTQPVFAG